MGGFHLKKIMNACCDKYLKDTGVYSIFVENEVYGPENVKSAMIPLEENYEWLLWQNI